MSKARCVQLFKEDFAVFVTAFVSAFFAVFAPAFPAALVFAAAAFPTTLASAFAFTG
jgi:hypothetical protein